MKAIQLVEFGPNKNIQPGEASQPTITDDQVLVKVYAASVNQLEIKISTGAMQQMFPVDLPWIPGSDFAGVIEKTGKNVTAFKSGDEVYGNCPGGGAYAEYVAADADKIAIKPPSLSFEEAASVPVVALTAYQGLFLNGRLKAGQTILIHGGAGAVGAYAVQLAKNGGAHVIATATGEDVEFVHSLGADKVVDYQNEKFEDHLEGVDLVFDVIGGETQQRSYTVMKKGAMLVATSQPPKKEEADKYEVNAMMMNMQPATKDLEEIAELINAGTLKTDVAKVYELEKASEGWAAISGNINKDGSKAGEKIGHGKAVLKISGN